MLQLAPVCGEQLYEDRAVPNTRQTLGQRGEELAMRYLQQLGYVIVERNYRSPEGEIDIIAHDQGRLAFVEVRTRRGTAFGTPEESITFEKQARLATVARQYLQEKGDWDVEWGIDVVAVEFSAGGVLQRIDLIRNAVMEKG
nr:YraN family protein [Chloroflexota bacterium]